MANDASVGQTLDHSTHRRRVAKITVKANLFTPFAGRKAHQNKTPSSKTIERHVLGSRAKIMSSLWYRQTLPEKSTENMLVIEGVTHMHVVLFLWIANT
eukprot:6214500-Pleurochrysis_carterae.AAC.9